MVTTLSFGSISFRLPQPRNGVSWAIAFSVLLHVAVGWYFISRLMIEPQHRPDEPISVTIEPAPITPKREEPVIKHDPAKIKNDRPRKEIRIPKTANPDSTVEAAPMPPAPPQTDPGPTTLEPVATEPAVAPTPTKRVMPEYPEKAEEDGKNGEVEVYLTVSADGAVLDVQIVREDPQRYGFGRAAIAAVRRWEFAGAAPGTYRLTVKFRMPK